MGGSVVVVPDDATGLAALRAGERVGAPEHLAVLERLRLAPTGSPPVEVGRDGG